MQYRSLGRTGLSVSVIGFGASPLGGVFGHITSEQSNYAVKRAITCGINLFDVSPYYGHTLAEQRLGDALKEHRNEVLLATKCGRYGAGSFDFSGAAMIGSVEASLTRLKTDHVDLLQLHDVEFASVDQIIHESIPALRLLQQQGKTRFIGITGYWPNHLAHIARETNLDTILNYCHLNLFMDDIHEELVPTSSLTGIGLMNASPLHMGLLGGGPVPDWHPAPVEVKNTAKKVTALCHEYGVNPASLALNQCLRDQSVASTFIGLSSPEQVDESLLALDFDAPPELSTAINRLVQPVFNIAWPSGLAENQPGVFHAH